MKIRPIFLKRKRLAFLICLYVVIEEGGTYVAKI